MRALLLASRRSGELVGVSCLAVGADQVFASLILEIGGRLHAVLPFAEIERSFDAEGVREFRELRTRASSEEIIEVPGTDEDSFMAAGERVVDLADEMIAVWNGMPAKGKGGTADVVAYAGKKGVPVHHVNPVNRTVTSIPPV